MSTKEKKYKDCERCVYGIKNYFSISNRLICTGVSACSRLEKPSKEKPFE